MADASQLNQVTAYDTVHICRGYERKAMLPDITYQEGEVPCRQSFVFFLMI